VEQSSIIVTGERMSTATESSALDSDGRDLDDRDLDDRDLDERAVRRDRLRMIVVLG
jgi:hypothetical protein